MNDLTPDSAPLWTVFYVSRSTAAPDSLDALLRSARRNNAERGVTGALVFTGGHFAQVLEGPPGQVRPMMDAIERDLRHEAVRRLIDAPLPQRRFGAWAMALVDAPGADDVLQDLLHAEEVSVERASRVAERLFSGQLR